MKRLAWYTVPLLFSSCVPPSLTNLVAAETLRQSFAQATQDSGASERIKQCDALEKQTVALPEEKALGGAVAVNLVARGGGLLLDLPEDRTALRADQPVQLADTPKRRDGARTIAECARKQLRGARAVAACRVVALAELSAPFERGHQLFEALGPLQRMHGKPGLPHRHCPQPGLARAFEQARLRVGRWPGPSLHRECDVAPRRCREPVQRFLRHDKTAVGPIAVVLDIEHPAQLAAVGERPHPACGGPGEADTARERPRGDGRHRLAVWAEGEVIDAAFERQ